MSALANATGTHVTVGSWLPVAMADEIAELARSNDRSVSGEVRLALRRHLSAARSANVVSIAKRGR
jgi:hypothetical protein